VATAKRPGAKAAPGRPAKSEDERADLKVRIYKGDIGGLSQLRIVIWNERGRAGCGFRLASLPIKPCVSVRLEPDVSTQLEDACGIRADDLSKRGADVLGIGVKVLEFGVVEEVEGIDAEFERDAFAIERRGFCQR
jgi:hypothetical protein